MDYDVTLRLEQIERLLKNLRENDLTSYKIIVSATIVSSGH